MKRRQRKRQRQIADMEHGGAELGRRVEDPRESHSVEQSDRRAQPTAGRRAQPTAGEKGIPNCRRESKRTERAVPEENNVSKREVGPMARYKDTESHQRMATDQEWKAREHPVEIEEDIGVDKQKAGESKGKLHSNNRRSSKQLQIAEEAKSIAEKDSEERKT